ncbi:MAG: CBS domain-containing protein [Gammaproteobacteria bacterium]|nr:CBS domain-containing protein [Gammaproteobacteria bacterium]
MNVRDIMSATVTCCGLHDDLESIALLMMSNDCGSIPITNDMGQPIGMITDRDIAMAAAARHKALWQLYAEDFLTGQPVSVCNEDDDIHAALAVMQRARVHRLPVVNGDSEILGILSMDDVIGCAERGVRGQGSPDISYDDAVNTLKVMSKHH